MFVFVCKGVFDVVEAMAESTESWIVVGALQSGFWNVLPVFMPGVLFVDPCPANAGNFTSPL